MYESMAMFVSVVDHKSINRASHTLNVSQPALSRKISKLEQELGVQLFDRVGNRLVLTEAGMISYEYAKEMMQLERQFRDALIHMNSDHKIQLTIGASLTTLQSTLPEFIAQFMNHSPDIELKTKTGKTHEVVEMIKEKEIDFGLVASKISSADLVCLPLFDDHLVLVLPADHPFLHHHHITIQMLNELPMILFSKGTWYRVMMDELFARYHVHPKIMMEIDSFEAIVRLLAPCSAATLLPKSYLQDQEQLTVVSILELEQSIRTTSLIYSKENPLIETLALDTFFSRMQNHFGQES